MQNTLRGGFEVIKKSLIEEKTSISFEALEKP
jgi:hypothetical protein